MSELVTVYPDSNCNCSPYSQPDGEKGTTVWSPNDIDLAPNATITWTFTDTQPMCSFTDDSGFDHPITDACFLIYNFETIASADLPYVRLKRKLNGDETSASHHSSIDRHNVTECYEFCAFHPPFGPGYKSGDMNTIELINDSPIHIQLKNIKIIRAYAMKGLGYNFSPDPGKHCCGADSGASGNIDYTRQDYPCNYQSYGDRLSFVHYGAGGGVVKGCSAAGPTLPPGQSKAWTFIHPTAGHNNYVGSSLCIFNFNNVQLGAISGQADLHYSVMLNGNTIANYYHCRQDIAPQFPTVDLAKFPQYYHDEPGAANTIELYNHGDVDLLLKDGEDANDPGRIDIYRFYRVANLCQDNFMDLSGLESEVSSRLWDPLNTTTGTTITENGQLQIQLPGGSWSQVGYVTHNSFDVQQAYGPTQQGFEAVINVTSMGSLKEMNFMISSDSKITAQDPTSLSNWYRIYKDASNSTVKVQNRLNGGTVSTKAQTAWASSTGELMIKVSTGSIAFYENGVLKYAEPFALPSNNCFLYVYASSDQNGTGTFDDYALYPAKIYRTEFSSGTLDGWTIDDDYGPGSWTIFNGRLQSTSTTYNAHIHYNAAFALNRHVKADIQTISSTSTDNVAQLMVKEVDGNNRIAAFISADHRVKLQMHCNGQSYHWQSNQDASLDPMNLNRIAVSVIGENAKVWVNGQLYIPDANDSHFNDFGGYVGLYTPGATGAYDYVAVLNATGSEISCQSCEVCEGCQGCQNCESCVARCYGFCQTCVTACEFCESGYNWCQLCQSTMYTWPCYICESCFSCQGCQPCEDCQVCVAACQSCQPCETCQTCQTCYAACYALEICYLCEASCFSCEACQFGCQVCQPCQTCQPCEGCQTACELSCQTTCETACQSTCQLTCQTTCELSCQATCQLSCQSCNTCQTLVN